jgi:hypothetical protein
LVINAEEKIAIILTYLARIGPIVEKNTKNQYVEKIMIFWAIFLTLKDIVENRLHSCSKKEKI